MLKPSDSLIYVYYECSNCQEKGDELRLSEVKHKAYHHCEFCGNVDMIQPIKDISFVYSNQVESKKEVSVDNSLVKSAEKLLVGTGMNSGDAKKCVKLAYRSDITLDELFKLAVLEHDKLKAK